MLDPSASASRNDEDGTSPYLLAPPRTLGEVCRATGRDDGGRRCPRCGVRDLCLKQEGIAAENR